LLLFVKAKEWFFFSKTKKSNRNDSFLYIFFFEKKKGKKLKQNFVEKKIVLLCKVSFLSFKREKIFFELCNQKEKAF
jgi:hypothetical protein